MATNDAIMGSIRHDQRGWRTNQTINKLAKTARQNAICVTRTYGSHPSNVGALAKNPLVLHKTAAAATSNTPPMGRRELDGRLSNGLAEFMIGHAI